MSAKRIVIIDDDPEICDALSQILSQCGYEVFTALDTSKGYQLFVDTRPDLLILAHVTCGMFATKTGYSHPF